MNTTSQTVRIDIGPNMYSRFTDLPNTVPHVLAEFVDNALQSYFDNKEHLHNCEDNYVLTIKITIEWDEETQRASKITIIDNAAGINEYKYKSAFMPARTPDDNSGLNEFGMGLKTAALWLGETWTVTTKALSENVSRSLTFNLNEVTKNNLEELPIETLPAEEPEHYTTVIITDLTKNAPSRKSLERIRTNIASIYRKSLRNNEVKIIINDEQLTFEEYPILIAPPANKPDAAPVLWRKEIDFSFLQYKAKGFIAILRDIDSTKNGFALLRRGRVIVGAEVDGRYFPKMSGSVGTFTYKRIFGELELEGFDVSFNKNDIQDKENLEALMAAIREEIRTPDFDILNQAANYRLNETKKNIDKIVKRHNSASKKNTSQISIKTTAVTQPTQPVTPTVLAPESKPVVLGQTHDEYTIDDKKYKLTVEFVASGNRMFAIDSTRKNEGVIVCIINAEHDFFKHFGKPNDAIIAIIKTIAISKIAAREYGNDSSTELIDYFDELIKQTKV